nr:Ig-like domain-containing protein [Desulfuromonadales bacterium]NIS41229.1 Ig-like domain-containing protein [Desulfuromonadales bacterium]
MTTPLQVGSTLPADGDAGVPPDSNVAITWDQAVDCATVNTGTVTATSVGWALVSCSESRAVFFASGQGPLETNQVSVTTNVRSAAGRAMEEAFTFSYTISAPPPDWNGTILEGGAGIDSARDGVTDAAGNIYLVGTTSSPLF